jgi:hypothetical protein
MANIQETGDSPRISCRKLSFRYPETEQLPAVLMTCHQIVQKSLKLFAEDLLQPLSFWQALSFLLTSQAVELPSPLSSWQCQTFAAAVAQNAAP